ncbi:ABC-2 transporter permease [Clostridium estertheticum]|uniref:ABC-2 transporter permease n=1 Tax=Clostridium estertheticum TaxID=238834 RepID=UPI002715399D|nr:ABC-2 transporter permease [Clostridium estertheticum]
MAYEYFKNSCENDYKYNANIMFSSLPINRREVVFSKYIESMLFLIFAIICTIAFTFVFRRIGVSGPGVGTFIHLSKLMHLDDFSKLMNFKSIIMYSILSTILFISIYFPIYFKLEYLKVRNIFALVSILICFVPILVLYIMGSENIYNIVKYFSGIPGIIANIALICILFIILYISVNISIKYYENKDLIF